MADENSLNGPTDGIDIVFHVAAYVSESAVPPFGLPMTIVFQSALHPISFFVREEPLRARLGAVDADDPEVLGAHLLDARLNDTGGLAKHGQREALGSSFFTIFAGFSGRSHHLCLSVG